MTRYTFSLLLFILIISCGKKKIAPNTEPSTADTTNLQDSTNNQQDTTITPEDTTILPTSDFRSAYVGDFFVRYVDSQSNNGQWTSTIDTEFVIRVDYQVSDSILTIDESTFNPPHVVDQVKRPIITLYLKDSVLAKWKIRSDGKVGPTMLNDGLQTTYETGGFIDSDHLDYYIYIQSTKYSKRKRVIGYRVSTTIGVSQSQSVNQ